MAGSGLPLPLLEVGAEGVEAEGVDCSMEGASVDDTGVEEVDEGLGEAERASAFISSSCLAASCWGEEEDWDWREEREGKGMGAGGCCWGASGSSA